MTEKIKVLIADDHALMRMGLKALLETQPDIETVGEASDGSEAVRKARKSPPDVVIMDILMPGTDGIEATRRITEANSIHPMIAANLFSLSVVLV